MFLITVYSAEKCLQRVLQCHSMLVVPREMFFHAYVSGDVPCFFMAGIETIPGTQFSHQCEGQRSQKV